MKAPVAWGVPALRSLAQKLDVIAGVDVLEKRAVGIVAAVVRGKDALLLKAYGRLSFAVWENAADQASRADAGRRSHAGVA